MSFFYHLLSHRFVNDFAGFVANEIAKDVLEWTLTNGFGFTENINRCIEIVEIQILNLHFFIEKLVSKGWLNLRINITAIILFRT